MRRKSRSSYISPQIGVIATTGTPIKAMCPRSAANIWQALPIARIVLRVKAFTSEIRNLIVFKAFVFSHFYQGLKHRKLHIFLHLFNPPFLPEFEECSPFLYHQAIARKVRNRERQSQLHILSPFLQRLIREPIDKINTDILYPHTIYPLNSLNSLLSSMTSI